MKERVEEINRDITEPSSPKEDEQLLFERLTKIKEQIKKNKEKVNRKKDTKEETLSFQNMRTSSRLRGRGKKMK